MSSNNKTSTYPKYCLCCEIPILLNNKHSNNYHTNKRTSEIKMSSTPNTTKKTKLSQPPVGEAKNWLMGNMNVFIKSVKSAHGENHFLKTLVELTEEGINNENPELSEEVWALCVEELNKLDNKLMKRDAVTFTFGELKVGLTIII